MNNHRDTKTQRKPRTKNHLTAFSVPSASLWLFILQHKCRPAFNEATFLSASHQRTLLIFPVNITYSYIGGFGMAVALEATLGLNFVTPSNHNWRFERHRREDHSCPRDV